MLCIRAAVQIELDGGIATRKSMDSQMAVSVNIDRSGPTGSCEPERPSSAVTVGCDCDMDCGGRLLIKSHVKIK